MLTIHQRAIIHQLHPAKIAVDVLSAAVALWLFWRHQTLDGLGVDRVYADFWLAYRLTFDTNERIIGAQNKFQTLTFVDGVAIASHHPFIRHRQYERIVEADPNHGFVFFRVSLGRVRGYVAQLRQHGYRHVVVGPFVVYTRPR